MKVCYLRLFLYTGILGVKKSEFPKIPKNSVKALTALIN